METVGLELPEWTKVERLVKARTSRGITIEEMADRLGVSTRTIQNWERGEHLTDRAVKQYAQQTGLPTWWIEVGELGDNLRHTAGYDITWPALESLLMEAA